MIRICTFLLLASSISAGQATLCSAMKLRVEADRNAATPKWRVYLVNRSPADARIHIPSQRYRWQIEKHKQTTWDIVLSGGVGAGVGAEASPRLGTSRGVSDTVTIGRGERHLITDFDVRRDVSHESLDRRSTYRIVFEQQIELTDTNGTRGSCKLTSSPKVFRTTP
jgi:hypothetical protein